MGLIVLGVHIQGGTWQRSVFFHLIFLPYVVIACSKHFKAASVLNKWDISYGLYIYGGVVQQCLEAWLKGRIQSPILFFCVSVVLAVPIAYLSWRFVEQPAMRAASAILRRRPAVLNAVMVKLKGRNLAPSETTRRYKVVSS